MFSYSRSRLLAVALLVFALATQHGTAQAGAIFQYESTCVTNCANIGLTAGDSVFGTIGITDAAVGAGVLSGIAGVESFDLHFGTFTFGLPSLGFASGTLNAARDAFLTFNFITNALGSDPGYNFSHVGWIAGPSVSRAAGGGAGTLSRVPEPGTLALLGLGLAALAATRRRRQ